MPYIPRQPQQTRPSCRVLLVEQQNIARGTVTDTVQLQPNPSPPPSLALAFLLKRTARTGTQAPGAGLYIFRAGAWVFIG